VIGGPGAPAPARPAPVGAFFFPGGGRGGGRRGGPGPPPGTGARRAAGALADVAVPHRSSCGGPSPGPGAAGRLKTAAASAERSEIASRIAPRDQPPERAPKPGAKRPDAEEKAFRFPRSRASADADAAPVWLRTEFAPFSMRLCAFCPDDDYQPPRLRAGLKAGSKRVSRRPVTPAEGRVRSPSS
jgi:hypothetical protein